MFPVIVSLFVDLNINLTSMFEIENVFQLKVANMWTNKLIFIGARAQINICENLFGCVSGFVMKTVYDFPSGLCTGV